MKSIKTAISIDPITFNRIERLTKRLHMSRSQFFTQAAQCMIEKNDNLELLQKINVAGDGGNCICHSVFTNPGSKTCAQPSKKAP